MNLEEETKFLIRKYNISAKKNLGQNFLIDEKAIESILRASNVNKDDLVIEIGPGLGTLTSELVNKAGKVICIELDNKMVKILEERFKLYNNLKIINEDVLKLDLNKIIKEEKKENIKNTKIVANLPYYITTPIVMKLLEEKLDVKEITVMVQKEVAERLACIPGEKETGSITYTVWYYSNPKIIVDVSKESFIPKPEVTSSVIKFEILNKPRVEVKDEKEFFRLIKIAFFQKRKTLVNALLNGGVFKSREEIENILEKIGLDNKVRGEKLTLEDYKKISEYL